jgi:hypothetical protein
LEILFFNILNILLNPILSFSAEFITMAANTLNNNTRRTPMAKYIHSTIQCHVVLDRLEQSAIDQIMQNSLENDQTKLAQIVCIFFKYF